MLALGLGRSDNLGGLAKANAVLAARLAIALRRARLYDPRP